jgi:glycosyltransferase involved in cell wall biosynthesis
MVNKSVISSGQLVTIYTTIFNVGAARDNCIEAILGQTHKNFEWVIVYDLPEDRVAFKALSAGDERIRYVHNESPGRFNALAVALKHCHTELIFNQDFDDVPTLERIEHQISALLENENLAAVGGWYLASYDDSGIVEEHFDVLDSEAIRKILPFWFPFAHSFCGFRKSALLDVGGYPLGCARGWYHLVKNHW